LLPKLATACARVRGIAQIAVADGHPLVVPRVRQYLEPSGASERHLGKATLCLHRGTSLATMKSLSQKHFL
jgi:hypothetical protein